MLALCFAIVGLAFIIAYFVYGRFLDRQMNIDPEHRTPAHELRDNVDYVPAAKPVLFGHHFSSIAGAGPIVGPVVAALAFGWFPAMLWIILGAIFVGGVHDYTSLVASIRHRGRSIGEICKQYLPPFTYYMFLVFIWFTLVYVLIVFLDLVASGFAPAVPDLVRRGGSVASASVLYVLIAIACGVSMYRFKASVRTASLIFVPMVFLAMWVGHKLPLSANIMPLVMGSAKNTWCVLLLVYCFVASITPVWILLQPRDFLSSFLLYACLIGGAVGIFVAGVSGKAAIAFPAFITFNDPHLGFIYPALVINVACGAVSGFHSIVASGTTSKQLDRESSARPIAYGSMLVEGILAFVALASVMILSANPSGKGPVAIFAEGIGTFLASLGVSQSAATLFGLLAVSTFLLTTLDTCTRLARFVFQEIFQLWTIKGRILGTVVTLALPAVIVFKQIPGPNNTLMPAWKAVWPAFGATNQLMAALALIMVYAWLRKQQKTTLYVLVPAVFMCVTTVAALSRLSYRNLFQEGSLFVGGLSGILLVLGIIVVGNTAWVLHIKPTPHNAEIPLPNPER